MLEFLKETKDVYLLSEFDWDNPLQYENGVLELLMYGSK